VRAHPLVVSPGQLTAIADTVGDTLTVKARSRRGAERELKWKIGSRQELSYIIKDLESVTAEQRARRTAWLKGEVQTADASAVGALGTHEATPIAEARGSAQTGASEK